MKKANRVCFETLPKRKEILLIVEEIRNYIHPDVFETMRGKELSYKKKKLNKIKRLYKRYICPNTAELFVEELPNLEKELNQDLDFFMLSDPAIKNREEVIISYPGYLAITYYRIAHIIEGYDIPYVPRIITEAAHSKTGIDINPGARIGVPFFIDHGTGIVIGETAEIGKNVKMYHGVTIGALSLKNIDSLKGKKRHPTIEDNVTLYAGASILGGKTVIEEGATIGSNVFIVDTVVKGSTVIYTQKNEGKQNNEKD